MDETLLEYIEEYENEKDLKNKNEEKWLNRFIELLRFKSEHGHLDVPVNYEKFKSLGPWVRQQKKALDDKNLDPLRKKLLNYIGL